MTHGISTFIYPVKDIAQARTLYRTLSGVEPEMDEPYYVGFSVGDQHVGLNPNGHNQAMTGPVGYLEVEDVKARLLVLLDAGAQPHQESRTSVAAS